MTMWTMVPEVVEPDLVALLVTITAMKVGSGPAGGGELLPGAAVKVAPQVGVVGLFAKPLKLLGAAPPLKELVFAHCAPQNVTEVPIAEFWSPMTKAPPPGAKEKPSVVQDVTAWAPPTSLMVVVIVKVPVVAKVCVPE